MSLLYIEILLVVIFIFLSAFFSGSETALFSLSKFQIEKLVEENPDKGKRIRDLIERPKRLIITIILGNEFVNVAISSLSAGIIIRIFHQEIPWINIGIVLPILLIFSEITPKTIALKNNTKFASFVVTPLSYLSRFTTPVRWFIRNISDGIVNIFVKSSERRESILTEDVIRTIVEEGEKEGIIDSLEREFIYKVFDFGDMKVDEVMTPRANLFCLSADTSLDEIIKKIKEKHYSKVPVYKDDQDNIIGILFATDLIGLTDEEIKNSDVTLKKILRKPYFVPITKRADELFKTFQKEKISIAIVLDEYGGVLGLVTMEDLLEVIFGEISDEFEKEDKLYEKVSDSVRRVKASMTLDEFNELFGSNIFLEDVDTIGGFVFSLFGEFPKPKSVVNYHDFTFTVERVSGNRIEAILVREK
jgi:putative hemolysin